MCYVGLEEHEDSLLRGLEMCSVRLPVVLIGRGGIRKMGPRFSSPELECAFAEPMAPMGLPPDLVRVSDQSRAEDFDRLLHAQIAARMARRDTQPSLRSLVEGAVPHLAIMSPKYRGTLLKKFEDAALRLGAQHPDEIRVIGKTSKQNEVVIEILQNPEDADPRGRTQKYQAFARPHPAGSSRRQETPGQRRIEDYLDELGRLADSEDAASSGEEEAP